MAGSTRPGRPAEMSCSTTAAAAGAQIVVAGVADTKILAEERAELLEVQRPVSSADGRRNSRTRRLIERKGFVDRNSRCSGLACEHQGRCLVRGFVDAKPSESGNRYNAAGAHRRRKRDGRRSITSGYSHLRSLRRERASSSRRARVRMTTFRQACGSRSRYARTLGGEPRRDGRGTGRDPIRRSLRRSPTRLVTSRIAWDKGSTRPRDALAPDARARELLELFFSVFVNQVGGQDDLVFAGTSKR